ncbi:MAG: HPP family protein [Acidimicrobiales bacterium]
MGTAYAGVPVLVVAAVRTSRLPGLEGEAMLCVKDVMHTDLCRVEPGETIADVARTLIFHGAECALVVEGEELLGIVSERDLLGIVTERDLLKAVLPTAAELNEAGSFRAFSDLVAVARDHFAASVGSVMTRPVRTIDRDAGLIRALGTMLSGGIHRLPVVGPKGEVVGVVTQPDLLRAVFLEWQHGTGAPH